VTLLASRCPAGSVPKHSTTGSGRVTHWVNQVGSHVKNSDPIPPLSVWCPHFRIIIIIVEYARSSI